MGYIRADSFIKAEEIKTIKRKTKALSGRICSSTNEIGRIEKWMNAYKLSKAVQNPDLMNALTYVVEQALSRQKNPGEACSHHQMGMMPPNTGF